MRTGALLVLTIFVSGFGVGCGSVSGIADGGGAGSGGGGGGHAGTSGSGGAGGSSGASCDDLVSQYNAALSAARQCTVGAAGACQQSVSASLSHCFLNCMTFVNDASALNTIKTSWEQAGCDNSTGLCPAFACVEPSSGMCVAGDSGGGVCAQSGGVVAN